MSTRVGWKISAKNIKKTWVKRYAKSYHVVLKYTCYTLIVKVFRNAELRFEHNWRTAENFAENFSIVIRKQKRVLFTSSFVLRFR